MKIVALGDIHGRDSWEKIAQEELDSCDKFIFIGDYFDSFDIPFSVQMDNFKNILDLKRKNMDKVVLLFGNHCYHYLKGIHDVYSGYQSFYSHDIGMVIEKALKEDLIQMCFIHDKFLFSHAGVTNTWLSDNGYNSEEPLDVFINDLFKYKPLSFRFKSGKNRSPYGDDVCQSPIWVRPNSLLQDKLDDYVYVVGHTQQNELMVNDSIVSLILIDTLGTSGEYLQIIDGEASVKKIST